MRNRRRRYRDCGLVAAMLLLGVLFFPQPWSPQRDAEAVNPVFEWPNVLVDDSTAIVGSPAIAVDTAGTLHVVWRDSRLGDYDVQYSRSLDGGLTWSASVRLDTSPAGTNAYEPAIAVDRTGDPLTNGTVYVLWREQTTLGNRIYAAVSQDYGVTWSSNIRVDDAPDYTGLQNPDVAVDGAGRAYAVWEDQRGLPQMQLFLSDSTDRGSSWGTSVPVTAITDLTVPRNPAITATDDGMVNIAWQQNGTGYSIRTARSSDAGATWTAQIVIAGGASEVFYQPDITSEAGGRRFLVWNHAETEFQIQFARSTDYGVTWSAPTRVSDGTGQTGDVTVASVGGNPYAVWADDRKGDWDIYASGSEDDGATWGDGLDNDNDPRVDDTAFGSSTQRKPASAASRFGLYVVWEDARNTPDYDIYFSRYVFSQVLISEIRDSPDPAELVEIVNYGGKTVDFAGYQLRIDDVAYIIPLDALGAVPPMSRMTVGKPGSGADVEASFLLGDQGGTLELYSPAGLVDTVRYGQMGTVPDPLDGESTARYFNGDVYTNQWARDPTPTFGVRNDGPGAVADPPIVLTEVLYDAGNPAGRFVELYYGGTGTLNTTDLILVGNSAYTILNGRDVTPADRSYVVWNDDSPETQALFGNLLTSGDNLYLYNETGWLLDMVGWSSTHAQDTSVCRFPNGNGTHDGYDDASSSAAGWLFGCTPSVPIVAIGPPQTQYAHLGEVVRFNLTVTNKQGGADFIDITNVSGPNGWFVATYEADGTTPLQPSILDNDPVPDTGELDPGGSVGITVYVTVPNAVQPTSEEYIDVTASSSIFTFGSDTVRLTVSLIPFLRPTRDLVPDTVDMEGSGGQEVATVTLNVTGLGQVPSQPQYQDVILIIDSSGSMSWNDPNDDRKTGAKYYIDQLQNPDRAAIVDFDSTACLAPGKGNPPNNPCDRLLEHHLDSLGHDGVPDYTDPKADVDTIDSSGGTNLWNAMNVANRELITVGDPNHIWVEIFLTDGLGSSPYGPPDLVQEAADNGIIVFTIGMGNADYGLLQRIATDTGGTFYQVPDPSYLVEIYGQIHLAVSLLAGSDPYPDYLIPMIEEVVPPYVNVVPGSFARPPWSIETDPNPDYMAGGMMQWNVSGINLNRSWVVSYDVTCSLPGTRLVAEYPDSRVAYVSTIDTLVVAPFPERLITCTPSILPPINVTTSWTGGTPITLTWEEPGVTPDHYLIYRVADDPRGFTDLSPGAAYASVSAPATTWTDSQAVGGPGELYYLMRSANANESDLSETSNTAGVFVGQLNAGTTVISRPLEYFPWVDYSGAEPNTVGEYVTSFSVLNIRYMDADGEWRGVPGSGDMNTPLGVGGAYVVESMVDRLFAFAGLPGAMIQYDDYAYAGFDPAGDALSLTADVNGDDVELEFAQPGGMTAGVDYYYVYYATSRTGLFDGTAVLVGGGPVIAPATSTVTLTHFNALTAPDGELYYTVVPVTVANGRGSSSYSIGVWTRTFAGHETLGLPLRPQTTHTVDWYCDAIPNVLGMDFYGNGYWVGHVPAMPAGVYDADVVMGAGYQITVSPGTGRYSFVGW